MSVATARTSRRPSATAVVSQLQLYGAALSVQAVVQVLAPAGEVWKTTVPMPRSEVATALSVTLPRSGEPGSVIETKTVLKLDALLKIEPGLLEPATNAASELRRPTGSSTASTTSPVRAHVMRLVRKARSMGGTCARARYVSHRPLRSRS